MAKRQGKKDWQRLREAQGWIDTDINQIRRQRSTASQDTCVQKGVGLVEPRQAKERKAKAIGEEGA